MLSDHRLKAALAAWWPVTGVPPSRLSFLSWSQRFLSSSARVSILVPVVLVVHGLIYVMGFAKAFHLAAFEQMRAPISQPVGLLWLAAGDEPKRRTL